MMKFNAQEAIKALGLEKGGRVQQAIDSEILRVCDPYIPKDEGNLIESGIENTKIGSGEIAWPGPYAHYLYEGIVYVDPVTKCAGFLTDEGWKSRKGVTKVPSERKLQYQGESIRGDHWFDRAMQDGGLEQVEKAAQEAVSK